MFCVNFQPIPLGVYLEINPENACCLKKHINAGKLLVGSCYDLPDMNSVDSEAIVRNLFTIIAN